MPKNKYDIDWAEVVDLLAHEYGWTIKYIRTLTLGQISMLVSKIRKRYDAQDKATKDTQATKPEGSDFKPSSEEVVTGTLLARGGKLRTRPDGTKEIVI